MAYPFAAAEVLTAANLNAMIGAPTQNNQTGTTYSLALLDAGKTVTLSNASPVAVEVPAQATVTWANNTEINLLNIGAGLVTISGAAGVTVNGTPLTLAQNARGILIRTASNTWTFVPGVAAASPSGLTLITPTSIANSGGSASASGGAVTFTGVTNVSLNGIFTSTYDNYRVVVTSQGSITAQNYLIRYRTAGTDNSTSNYNTTRQDTNTGVVSSNFDSGQTSKNVGVTAIANDQLIIGEIFRPNLSALTLSSFTNWSTALTNILRFTGGYHNATTVFDGLTLFAATGTITGVIRVYGYQN